jgi:hypothetical protein
MIDGYIQNAEGKWVLTDEWKAKQEALYYSGRLAYDPQDQRFAVGRYTSTGEVIYFKEQNNQVKEQ